RKLQRLGPGVHGEATALEFVQDRLRHVLMVERDDVNRLREGVDGVRIAVVADPVRRSRRAHPLRLREHTDAKPQVDRGGHHHAGQLPAADDADGNAAALRRVRHVRPLEWCGLILLIWPRAWTILPYSVAPARA